MFRLYSKRCEYALRALVYGAKGGANARFQASEVCHAVGIPEPYTRKVFQSLVQGGFLTAVRGPGGGYELTKPPDKIGILDVIHAVDGPDTFDDCILGMPECGGEAPCPLHDIWSGVKETLLGQLAKKTLAELSTVPIGEMTLPRSKKRA